MGKKADKMYVWICVGLFVLCCLFYKTLRMFFCNLTLSLDLYYALGFLFAILATIHFNIFWGVDSGVERFFGSILILSFSYILFGGILYWLDWAIDHIKILP